MTVFSADPGGDSARITTYLADCLHDEHRTDDGNGGSYLLAWIRVHP